MVMMVVMKVYDDDDYNDNQDDCNNNANGNDNNNGYDENEGNEDNKSNYSEGDKANNNDIMKDLERIDWDPWLSSHKSKYI